MASRGEVDALMLLLNARSRLVGGWNALVVLSAVSFCERYRLRATFKALADRTKLSAGATYRTTQALIDAGLISETEKGNLLGRHLTPLGHQRLRSLRLDIFDQIKVTD